MRFNKIIIGLLCISVLLAQADKGREQSRPNPKKLNDGFVLEPVESQNQFKADKKVNISDYSQRYHYSKSNPTVDEDIIIEQGIYIPARQYNFDRSVDDTLTYYPADGGWNGQFIMSPGDAMMMTFKMPTEGLIKGINIPVYEWGTSDQELTVSLHKLRFPYDINGNEYPNPVVDGNGMIGGYDMDSTGIVYISGDVYTPGGTQGGCNNGNILPPNITDPLLAAEPGFGPPNVPPQGVVWPDSNNTVIMTPQTHPDYSTSNNLDNWIELQDFGEEYEFLNDEWIGLLFQYTGAGGGDETVGLFYEAGDGLVDPWRFLKFYDDCGGTSGNGGWHIRHWIIRTELAVELTGDRGPRFEDVSELNTTISIEDRTVTAHIRDDNPSGGNAGVASAQIIYQIDSLTAQINTINMVLYSGNIENGIWEGDIPGQEPGTTVYWYLSAKDVNGHTALTTIQSYYIFRLTSNELIFFNQNFGYGIGLPWGFDLIRLYFYWDSNDFDVWPASYGPLTDEFLQHYDVLIELAGGDGPVYNNDDVVVEWWGGDKTYIVAGDEWLSSRTWWLHWPLDVIVEILGVAAPYSDINYSHSGDQEGASRLMPDSTGVTSGLYEFLSDSLLLNYDPRYERGNDNWIDGFDVVRNGYAVDMTAYSGILDSNGNVANNAEIYNVMVHGQAGNGGKSAFMSFDPIALNTSPSYYWIGASSYWNLDHPNFPADASPLISVYEALQGLVSVEDEIVQPNAFSLKGNYPNPFNPVTNIQYELLNNTHVKITIYDILGRKVRSLLNAQQIAGEQTIQWDARNDLGLPVAAGVYLYKVEAREFVQAKKMLLLK